MKIFFPLQLFFPSQAGGPANSVYWLTKNLVREGFEPTIVATHYGLKPDVRLNQWSENEAGKVIYVKTWFSYFPLRQTLVSLLNFHRSEIVHLSSIFYPACFITAFAARIFGKKIVWSVRGELDTLVLTYSRFRKFSILWSIKRFIGSNYPFFHATCDEESFYIKKIFGDTAKILQLPNFIEIPALQKRADEEKFLLFIGRIHPKKGIENLLKALSISVAFLKSEHILKIAGKGTDEYESDLKKLVSELGLSKKTIFVGQVEGTEKQQLLADAFWTIMPSHTENFGLVVPESLAQNTPVIASKGSPWEVLETEKVGFWVDNSPENLASAINKIFQMPRDEYENYRRRSRNFVENEFDIEKNVHKWVEFYRSLEINAETRTK